MKKWICILLSFSLVLGLYACTKGTAEDLTESLKPQKIEKITDFTNGNQQLTQFGIDLFRTSHKQDENTLISPLSVLYALAMTANGAEAETLAQMESVFGLDIETLNLWLSSYQDVLSKELKLANSIWFRDSGDFTVNQAFLQANTDYYKADIFKAPFDSETCREINKWVEKKYRRHDPLYPGRNSCRCGDVSGKCPGFRCPMGGTLPGISDAGGHLHNPTGLCAGCGDDVLRRRSVSGG